jgi:hypothetical protein
LTTANATSYYYLGGTLVAMSENGTLNSKDSEAVYYYDYYYDCQWDYGYNYDYYYDPDYDDYCDY